MCLIVILFKTILLSLLYMIAMIKLNSNKEEDESTENDDCIIHVNLFH